MDKVLITGVTGFAGSHLADYLLDGVGGIEVHGTRRPRSREEFLRKEVIYHEVDIMDYPGLADAVLEIEPSFIFHLAAQSFVPLSWSSPSPTLETNILGTLNVLEAARALESEYELEEPGRHIVVQLAGSSEEYGLVLEGETPIKETNPLRPLSPYGVSKVAADLLCQQYYKSYGIRVIVTRGFNHSGPRRGVSFVTSNFAKQIATIERAPIKPIIYVGDLNAKRDWTDVRDVVRGYWMIANKGTYGEAYNICSGKTWSVGEMLDILLSFSSKKIAIVQDETRLRPSDVPVLLGDCSKLKKVIDWRPEIPFEKMLEDLLNYWRQKLD